MITRRFSFVPSTSSSSLFTTTSSSCCCLLFSSTRFQHHTTVTSRNPRPLTTKNRQHHFHQRSQSSTVVSPPSSTSASSSSSTTTNTSTTTTTTASSNNNSNNNTSSTSTKKRTTSWTQPTPGDGDDTSSTENQEPRTGRADGKFSRMSRGHNFANSKIKHWHMILMTIGTTIGGYFAGQWIDIDSAILDPGKGVDKLEPQEDTTRKMKKQGLK